MFKFYQCENVKVFTLLQIIKYIFRNFKAALFSCFKAVFIYQEIKSIKMQQQFQYVLNCIFVIWNREFFLGLRKTLDNYRGDKVLIFIFQKFKTTEIILPNKKSLQHIISFKLYILTYFIPCNKSVLIWQQLLIYNYSFYSILIQ